MKVAAALRAAAQTAADLLLPSVCPGCQENVGANLCESCLVLVERLSHPCTRCGTPREKASEACRACRGRGYPFLNQVRVDCAYRGLVEALIGDAKAGSRPAAGRALEVLLPKLTVESDTVVVPVPPSRGRRPGPHLATALAKAFARANGIAFRRLLKTTRAAAEQHRLTVAERRRNVAGLFSVAKGAMPKRIVLVDDLLTTGSTASAAATALRLAGAKRVDFIALARTPRT